MAAGKIDLPEMTDDQKAQSIKEITGKLEHKISETRLQQLSPKVNNSKDNRKKKVYQENPQLSSLRIRRRIERQRYMYLFINLRWCLR